MPSPFADQNPKRLTLLTATYSTLTVLVAFGFLTISDNLLRVGSFSSPIIWYFIAVEIAKYIIIKSIFRIDEQTGGNHKSYRDKKKSKESRNVTRIVESFRMVTMCAASVLFFVFLSITFGAPVFKSHEQTFSLAILLTATTIMPLITFLGVSGTVKVLFAEEMNFGSQNCSAYLRLLKNNLAMILLTAWSASIAFPLDWDRDWQVYPVPNVVGALIGYLCANGYSVLEVTLLPWLNELKSKGLF